MFIVLERVFDKGEHVSNKEIYRGEFLPKFKLKPNQAIFQCWKVKDFKCDHRLAFPEAHGLRKGSK